jgi:hypothetical protein
MEPWKQILNEQGYLFRRYGNEGMFIAGMKKNRY